MHTDTGRARSGDAAADPVRAHILILEARYYDEVADALFAGASAELTARKASFERITVPGALELPQALAAAADAGVFTQNISSMPGGAMIGSDDAGDASREHRLFDGVILTGCVIRGETSHYDIVCNNANHWCMEIATQSGIPLGNALLTVDTMEQALVRAGGERDGKGGDAARACLRLIEIQRQFSQRAFQEGY